jgi:hypothetical protein
VRLCRTFSVARSKFLPTATRKNSVSYVMHLPRETSNRLQFETSQISDLRFVMSFRPLPLTQFPNPCFISVNPWLTPLHSCVFVRFVVPRILCFSCLRCIPWFISSSISCVIHPPVLFPSSNFQFAFCNSQFAMSFIPSPSALTLRYQITPHNRYSPQVTVAE